MLDLKYIYGLATSNPSDFFNKAQEKFYQFSFKKRGVADLEVKENQNIVDDMVVLCSDASKEMIAARNHIYPGRQLLVAGKFLAFAGGNGTKRQGMLKAVQIYLVGTPWLEEFKEIQ